MVMGGMGGVGAGVVMGVARATGVAGIGEGLRGPGKQEVHTQTRDDVRSRGVGREDYDETTGGKMWDSRRRADGCSAHHSG